MRSSSYSPFNKHNIKRRKIKLTPLELLKNRIQNASFLNNDQKYILPYILQTYAKPGSPAKKQNIPWNVMGKIIAKMSSKEKQMPMTRQRKLAQTLYTKQLINKHITGRGSRLQPIILN